MVVSGRTPVEDTGGQMLEGGMGGGVDGGSKGGLEGGGPARVIGPQGWCLLAQHTHTVNSNTIIHNWH